MCPSWSLIDENYYFVGYNIVTFTAQLMKLKQTYKTVRRVRTKGPVVCLKLFLLTCSSWLGHAVGSIQGQDGVLGQRLLGRILGFSGATAFAEQVEVCLRRCRAGCTSCRSLCRSTGRVSGARLWAKKKVHTINNMMQKRSS